MTWQAEQWILHTQFFLAGTRCKKIENHWLTPSQDSFAAVKKWRFSTQTESNTSFSFNWITVSIVLAAGYLTSTCCPEVYAICCHSCYSMSIFNTFIWDVVLTPPRHCCIITTYITLAPPPPPSLPSSPEPASHQLPLFTPSLRQETAIKWPAASLQCSWQTENWQFTMNAKTVLT